jgi:hypothetical protein
MNSKLQEIANGGKQTALRSRHSTSMALVRDTTDTNDDLNSSGNRTDGDIQAEYLSVTSRSKRHIFDEEGDRLHSRSGNHSFDGSRVARSRTLTDYGSLKTSGLLSNPTDPRTCPSKRKINSLSPAKTSPIGSTR